MFLEANYLMVIFFFLAALGFEVRALHLLFKLDYHLSHTPSPSEVN
jgi:hypothetical protein